MLADIDIEQRLQGRPQANRALRLVVIVGNAQQLRYPLVKDGDVDALERAYHATVRSVEV